MVTWFQSPIYKTRYNQKSKIFIHVSSTLFPGQVTNFLYFFSFFIMLLFSCCDLNISKEIFIFLPHFFEWMVAYYIYIFSILLFSDNNASCRIYGDEIVTNLYTLVSYSCIILHWQMSQVPYWQTFGFCQHFVVTNMVVMNILLQIINWSFQNTNVLRLPFGNCYISHGLKSFVWTYSIC